MPGRSTRRQLILTGLKDAIISLVDGRVSTIESGFLLRAAYSVARELLSLKFQHNPGLRKYTGLSFDDLAYDSIADLFERDSSDALVHFKAYFSSFSVLQFTEAEALVHFRRLISSAVNQNVTHVLGDHDPALRKIIRNIKLTLVAHRTFEEIERFDETCIVPANCDTNEHLPEYDLEGLIALLAPDVRGDEFVPEMLAILCHCLREQSECSRITPLTDVALAFRTILLMKRSAISHENPQSTSRYELEDLIRKTVLGVSQLIASRYKTTFNGRNEVLQGYFRAIEYVLLSKVDGMDGSTGSLYEGLKHTFPGLSEKEYRTQHRTRLEYFYKLCRSALASEIIENR